LTAVTIISSSSIEIKSFGDIPERVTWIVVFPPVESELSGTSAARSISGEYGWTLVVVPPAALQFVAVALFRQLEPEAAPIQRPP
jgi:hypothetical protein